jgi:hypothetical protein
MPHMRENRLTVRHVSDVITQTCTRVKECQVIAAFMGNRRVPGQWTTDTQSVATVLHQECRQ